MSRRPIECPNCHKMAVEETDWNGKVVIRCKYCKGKPQKKKRTVELAKERKYENKR